MKTKFFKFFALLFFFPLISWGFLNDSDPERLYQLVEQAPWVVTGTVQAIQMPTTQRRYFVYAIKVHDLLSGNLKEKEIKVFQEQYFPDAKPSLSQNAKGLFFLAAMPNYTAYAKAVQEGARYRLFGGAQGVLNLENEQGSGEIVSVTREIIALKKEGKLKVETWKVILLRMLGSSVPILKKEGALGLGTLGLKKGELTSEEESTILTAIDSPSLGKKEKLALVKALKKSESLKSLRKIADGETGSIKWAAVRALEELGYPRTIQELRKDFENSDTKGKELAIGLIAKKKGEASKEFFQGLLSGSESFEIKREAVIKLGETGGTVHEKILLGQIENPDERVSAQVMLSLGKMQSSQSVSSVVPYLDSDSKILRDAATLSLYLNKDPQARKIFSERFKMGSSGEWIPKRHFSDVPGTKPEP